MSPQFSDKQQIEQLTQTLARLWQENDQLRNQLVAKAIFWPCNDLP